MKSKLGSRLLIATGVGCVLACIRGFRGALWALLALTGNARGVPFYQARLFAIPSPSPVGAAMARVSVLNLHSKCAERPRNTFRTISILFCQHFRISNHA